MTETLDGLLCPLCVCTCTRVPHAHHTYAPHLGPADIPPPYTHTYITTTYTETEYIYVHTHKK